VFTALVVLGLSETEAEVYVFLATAGPQKGLSIAEALKIKKPQLYRSVKSLQGKGLLNVTIKRASQFSAVPFEKALDLLVKAHLEEAQYIEQSKKEILSQWHAMINDKSTKVNSEKTQRN
jgi:sugar-specific transcriptional regulator TrmB